MFIRRNRDCFSVTALCRVLRVTCSGYHAWLGRVPCVRKARDRRLAVGIDAVFKRSRETYGSPRVRIELVAGGLRVGRNRIARIKPIYTQKTIVRMHHRLTNNQAHRTQCPRSIVHCRCAKSQVGYRCKFDLHRRSWMYLAAVIELISRRMVGYAMSESNDTRLALRALNSAKAARGRIDRLLHHSDRVSPDGSDLYIDRFCALHVQPSMSESGDCWDNAVAERFFSTREWELLRKRSFATHSQARRVVIAYIDQFFNLISRHSVNGYLTESSSNFAGNHVSSHIIDVSTNLRQAQALHFDTISPGLWRFLVSARFIRNSF